MSWLLHTCCGRLCLHVYDDWRGRHVEGDGSCGGWSVGRSVWRFPICVVEVFPLLAEMLWSDGEEGLVQEPVAAPSTWLGVVDKDTERISV